MFKNVENGSQNRRKAGKFHQRSLSIFKKKQTISKF